MVCSLKKMRMKVKMMKKKGISVLILFGHLSLVMILDHWLLMKKMLNYFIDWTTKVAKTGSLVPL